MRKNIILNKLYYQVVNFSVMIIRIIFKLTEFKYLIIEIWYEIKYNY